MGQKQLGIVAHLPWPQWYSQYVNDFWPISLLILASSSLALCHHQGAETSKKYGTLLYIIVFLEYISEFFNRLHL